MKMNRITSRDSHFTLLQQRLLYTSSHPDRPWVIIVDNVPPWPNGFPKMKEHSEEMNAVYGPCNGYDELIEYICQREKKKYNYFVSRDETLVTNGALHGLSLVFRHLFKPGAVAICLSAVLGSIYKILERIGYKIIFLETRHNGNIDFDKLDSLCKEDVQLIFADVPNNPFGDICSSDSLKALIRFTENRDISLVADLIYDSFVFGTNQILYPLKYSEGKKNVFIINSMSKGFGAPGLRIGWIISDSENIKILSGILEQECVSVCGVAQKQASYLLSHGNQILVNSVLESKTYMGTILGEIDGIKFKHPDGGTQFFVKLRVDDIDAFADFALIKFGLVLTTASNYAGLNEPYVRIPIGYPRDTSGRGVELLAAALNNYSN